MTIRGPKTLVIRAEILAAPEAVEIGDRLWRFQRRYPTSAMATSSSLPARHETGQVVAANPSLRRSPDRPGAIDTIEGRS